MQCEQTAKNIFLCQKDTTLDAFSRHSVSWQKCVLKPSPIICLRCCHQ